MKSSLIAAAIAAVALSTGAHAASTLTLSTINFKVTATGGLFQWVASNGTLGTSVQDLDWSTPGLLQYTPALTDVATIPADNAAAITSAAGNQASSTFGGPLSAISLKTGTAGGYAEATRDWYGRFYVAANTTVKFEWDNQLYGVNSGNTDPSVTSGTTNQMNVNSVVTVGNQTRKLEFDASAPSYAIGGFELGDNSIEHQSIVFKNTSSNAVFGVFHGYVKAYTRDVVAAAVPEPESYALALVGLGTIALVTVGRRRQR